MQLTDILDHASEEVGCLLSPRCLIVYGSFIYQDVTRHVASFPDLKSALDKKPDFIAVVDDLEGTLATLIDSHNVGKLESLRKKSKDTPFYFNLDTVAELHDGDETFSVPYKIGVVDASLLNKPVSAKTSYLGLRMTKPVHVIKDDGSFERYRKRCIRYAVSLLSERTPEKYASLSYKATAYRLFDWISGKPNKILGANVYLNDEMRGMRNIFQTYLDDNSNVEARPHRVRELALCNVYNLGTIFLKNVFVNNKSSVAYVGRKFARAFNNCLFKGEYT